MPKKTTSKKYSDYSKNTQTFMAAVEKHLVKKFGEIENQWDGLLMMLATNYELFWACAQKISSASIRR